ncbi:hypothetical protein [uncultured Desulfosarcina sp.]|uniref:hypothetical protein n=1 Tax=uncultured Desulfosarcina sp. TaxID=218289 RepID=UPI0029C6A209|nr:hypothetical protein [uncultured Desulfosarcina sp.]
MINAILLERLYLGITSLMQYIEVARPGNTLRWFAVGKTPVTGLPDLGYAREPAAELKPLLTSDCSNSPISDCRCPCVAMKDLELKYPMHHINLKYLTDSIQSYKDGTHAES